MTVTQGAPAPLLWLTEDDVRALVSLNDTVELLDETLRLEARGEAQNLPKALGVWGSSSMHVLGAMMPTRGYVAFKTWVNTPAGAMAVVSLFSAADGQLLALIEAAALGSLRTAAISGLATRALGAPDADEMALIGAGSQALTQVAAIAATRPLRRLRVFSPTPEKRSAFADKARATFPFTIETTQTVEAALDGAPIVTLATRARTPFVSAEMLAPGAHVNAIGAILPANAEFADDVLIRSSLIVVDSKANAAKNSREFIDHFGDDPARWERVLTLGEVLERGVTRLDPQGITLFKPMGMGLSDLAVAAEVYERAGAEGLGAALARGARAAPRWRLAGVPGPA